MDSVEIILVTSPGAEQTLGYLRLALLALALVGLGILGILLLATLRRAAQRRHGRNGTAPTPEAPGDAWAESARRMRVQSRTLPPPPNADDGTA